MISYIQLPIIASYIQQKQRRESIFKVRIFYTNTALLHYNTILKRKQTVYIYIYNFSFVYVITMNIEVLINSDYFILYNTVFVIMCIILVQQRKRKMQQCS
jgi:hypothetical protein